MFYTFNKQSKQLLSFVSLVYTNNTTQEITQTQS